MRLWHQDLIELLPRQQLLGQHRECCALRGNGWGKPHATVNYVFKRDFFALAAYHKLVMAEMERRGYKVDAKWKDTGYRGKKCEPTHDYAEAWYFGKIYQEHNDTYLKECLDNLLGKGITLTGGKL